MQGASRLFFILGILYAIGGMMLGLGMAMSHNHVEMPAHAHTMVADWLMSAVFAFFYHLFPAIGASRMAHIHFWWQAVTGVVLVVSLGFMLAGNDNLEPVTAISSIGFFIGMLIFGWNAMPALRRA